MTADCRGIAVVPCWRRPDLLQRTCELLTRAEGTRQIWYHFRLDRGYDPALLDVIQHCGLPGEIIFTPDHPYPGNSYNVLTGLATAYDDFRQICPPDGLIFLVEEDIHVSTDFFRWHYTVHQREDVLIASAVRDQNAEPHPFQDRRAFYCRPKYQSLGVSFKPRMVGEIYLHVGDLYFRDPRGYLQRRFPGSQIPWQFVEQDGLVDRLVEKHKINVAYPTVPRAYHAGTTGYHHGVVHEIEPCEIDQPPTEALLECQPL